MKKFFSINGIFLYAIFLNETSPEACLYYISTDCLNRVRAKLKNVIRSFDTVLNSKHRTEKAETKKQRNENMKNQNTETRIPKEKLENVD